jgi:hypothetical protein
MIRVALGQRRPVHVSPVVADLMAEETYGEERRRNLEQLLRTLAERIRQLDAEGALLSRANELMELLGDARTELFHYEVRATYDTPEVAENRRIIAEAKSDEPEWDRTEWKPDDDEGGTNW